MRRLDFTLTGVADADPRRRRDRTRARAGVVLAALLALIALGVERADQGAGPALPEPEPAAAAQAVDAIEPNEPAPVAPQGDLEGEPGDAGQKEEQQGDPSAQSDAEETAIENAPLKPPPPVVLARVLSEPEVLRFGDHPTGSPSQQQRIALTNTGPGMLTVAHIVLMKGTADNFRFDATCAGFVLAPNKPCRQVIVFKPTASGLQSATYELFDENKRSIGTFSIEGRAVSSDAEVSPASLDFTSSNSQEVTVTSRGEAPLRLTNVRVEGPAAFRSSGGACLHKDLRTGERCSFPVTFDRQSTPDVELLEARLIVEHNATGGRSEIGLQRRKPLQASLATDTSSVDFGEVNLGQSDVRRVVVTNRGNGPTAALTVGLARDQSPFKVSSDCSGPLQPKASCTVTVTFAPPGVAGFRNRLIIGDSTLLFVLVEIQGRGVRNPIN